MKYMANYYYAKAPLPRYLCSALLVRESASE